MAHATAELALIATPGEALRAFAPYVAAIDDAGTVTFQASLADGRTGVFAGDGGAVRCVMSAPDGLVRQVRSHPAVDGAGSVCFYAELVAGGSGVVVCRDGTATVIAQPAGALGPTMSASGIAGYRTADGIGAGDTIVAQVGARFAAFDGLPAVTLDGAVAFRANLVGGGQGIYLHSAGQTRTIAETGNRFASLARFPSVNSRHQVAFAAELVAGGGGVFVADGDDMTAIVDTGVVFERFRSALIDDAGRVVVFATPPAGAIGIYAGPDHAAGKVLAVGDAAFGSTVTSLVLNPVSMNERGELALRVELADGRDVIARATVASSS